MTRNTLVSERSASKELKFFTTSQQQYSKFEMWDKCVSKWEEKDDDCVYVFGTPKSRTQSFRMIQTVVPLDENRMNNRATIIGSPRCASRIPHMTVEMFNTTSLKIVQNLTCSILHHTVRSTCLLCYFLFGLLLISVECFVILFSVVQLYIVSS